MAIKKYINRENKTKKLVLDEKSLNELKELFPRQINQDEEQSLYIGKNDLCNLLQISEKKNFERIFEIFGQKTENKEDIITFESIEYLYYSFTNENPKIKMILFAFLIFGNKEIMDEKELRKIIPIFFNKNDNLLNPFFKYTIKLGEIVDNKKKKKHTHANPDDKNIERNDFFKCANEFEEGNLDIITNFHFIKKFKGISEFKLDDKNKNNLNFYCDCGKTSKEKKTVDKFDAMKREYDDKTNKTNKALQFTKFEKIMKYNQIEKNLINLIIDYTKKLTFKEYCCFKDLKYLCNNLEFNLPLENKKKFLFKMISTINKNEEKLTYEQITKYLNNENKDDKNKIEENNTNNNGSYDEADFIKNEQFDEMIKKMIPSLENFGLLPYLEFRVKTDDKNIRKRLINDTLKKYSADNIESYLETQFEESDYFYAIDVKFWNILINKEQEAPDYIDNSKIAEEIIIIKEEERYRRIEAERVNKNLEEERKRKEEREKKRNKNKGNNNNDGKNNEANKKEENKEEKKIKEIKTKNASLKPGMKYKKDFILVCKELFQILQNNYKIDYIIKFKKIQEVINLNRNKQLPNEKGKEKGKENSDEKEKDKEKENNKENQNEKEKGENKENKEIKEEKQKEDIDKVDEEEFIKKENLVKERLDKFIVDEERGFISKITKYDTNPNNKEYEGFFILNELDFYSVQTYTKTFGALVREIERAKLKYDELEKEKKFNESSENEKRKIMQQRNKEIQNIHDRSQKFHELKNKLQNKYIKNIITQEEMYAKYEELKQEFSDIFQKKEKGSNDYEVDITMSEFVDTMALYKNDILVDNERNILIRQRYKTYKDIKKKIFKDNQKILKDRKYEIYYYYFSTKTLFIPNDDFCFENEGKPYEPFVCIIVDISDENGENFYDLLQKKEKEDEKKQPKKKEKVKNKEKQENTEEKKTPTGENKQLNEQQKKEQQRLDKLEKEKLEKERKEKEKEEKEEKAKRKKEQEEYEKKRKEAEKKYEQRLKEIKQKEKEELQKKKQEQKEREQKLKRERELEPFISPPYGIDNYGNTCYFNSVNQIFLNLPILQQILLDPRIEFFINKNNKFGQQGKFLEIFRSLLWIKKSKVGDTVVNLKKMVGKLKKDFDNSQQQDANEYLNFLIDTLHEEINLHSSKIYIEEKDEIFDNNSVDEVGNFYWSNSLRRNASFIDSFFMFQLKSHLKCKKCGKVKYNFENNYMFDLPLSLCRMVTVEIYLYRLPFNYKLYYSEIDDKFKDYIEQPENKSKSIIKNLWNYYSDELTLGERKDLNSSLHFSFDLEREKTMLDIIKIIRGIKPLKLESEKIKQINKNEEMELFIEEQYTDFITYSREKKNIINPDEELDKYVNIEDKIIINIYEVLNSKGICTLLKEENSNTNNEENNDNKKEENNYINKLYSFISLKDQPKNFDGIKNKLSTVFEVNKNGSKNINETARIIPNIEQVKNGDVIIMSLKEKMIYLKNQEISDVTSKTYNLKYEFTVPIFHYKISSKKSRYLFRNFYHVKIDDFPVQYVVLNNQYNLSAKNLYDYIWGLNKLYMNHPNISTKDFWWNKINKNDNKSFEGKLCYPFVLRYLEIIDKKEEDYYQSLIHCPLCPWFSFCPGCVIDPTGDLTNIKSTLGIVVDWCYDFIEEELLSLNFKLSKDIDSQEISENFPMMDKGQNYQSIKDCFDLFFQEEELEDPLMCHQCKGPESFTKKYSINRFPYVLILSLKRFKYNKNSNFKLRQMITYPFELELENKKYDLYGVINHYGSINSGHYTAYIKNRNKKWTLCNDSSISEVKDEKRVMHSNAYILFYISKESPCNFDYIKTMKSLMNNIELIDKKNKKYAKKKDMNYFRYEPVEIIMDNKQNVDNKQPNKDNKDNKNNKQIIGYVMEENIEQFSVDDNYDIYNDLIKEDKIRIDNLIKKEGDKKKETREEEKNENDKNNDNKKKEKETIDNNKEEKKNEKENKKVDENNKEEKNEIKEEITDNNKKEEDTKKDNDKKEENKEDKKDENKKNDDIKNEIDKNEIKIENENELKKNEQLNENDKNKIKEDKNEIKEIKVEDENERKEVPNDDKNKKSSNYDKKNYVKVKLEDREDIFLKSKVRKIVCFEEKEKEKNKK